MKKAARILLWVLGSFLFLLLIVIVLLQIPATQRFLTNKAEAWLSDMLETKVEIGEIQLTFPKSVRLYQVYLEDQRQDTLLYGERVDIDIDYFALINGDVLINNIELEGITANIRRNTGDSSYNFDFILQAFASDTAIATDTTSSSQFYIGGLEVNNGRITYLDNVNGTDAFFNIGHLLTDFREFDLDKPEIFINRLELANCNGSIVQKQLIPPSPSSGMPDIALGFDKILISLVNFSYEDKVLKEKYQLKIGDSRIQGENIDFAAARIALKSFELHNSSIIVSLDKKTVSNPQVAGITTPVAAGNTEAPGWSFSLGELLLSGNTFRYDNNNIAAQATGIDFNHLGLTSVNADIKKIFVSESKTTAEIKLLALDEKSGFCIEDLSTDFTADNVSMVFSKLDLRTGGSHIRNFAALRFPSIDAISSDFNKVSMEGNFISSRLSVQDILYFQPDLVSDPFIARNRSRIVFIDGNLKGALNDLAINNLRISVLGTSLYAKGTIKGLPDINKTYFDLQIPKFSTSKADLYAILPPSMHPDGINLPATASMHGDFKGTIANFDLAATVTSSMGVLAGRMEMRPGTVYKAAISAGNFDLGALLDNRAMFGKANFRAKISGQGLNPETMRADIEAGINDIVINNYRYTNATLSGTIAKNSFTGQADLKDTNVIANFDGTIRFDSIAPQFNFNLNVVAANLKALKITESDVRVKGTLVADVQGTTIDNLNGDIGIRDVLIVKDGESYSVDSFLFVSVNQTRKTNISINSDLLTANFNGTIKLSELPEVLEQHFYHYYSKKDLKPKPSQYPQIFDFDIAIHNSDLITKVFFTDIKVLENAIIQGCYDSKALRLELNVSVPRMVYTNLTFDSLHFLLLSDSSRITYNAGVSRFVLDTLAFSNALVSGHIMNDSIYSVLALKDRQGREKYALGSVLHSQDQGYRFHILPSPVVLNYETWSADPDNYLEYRNGHYVVNNLRLNNDNSHITFNTIKGAGGGDNPAVQILFEDFRIATVSNIIEGENFMNGITNGELVLDKINNDIIFNSDLKVDSLSFLGNPIGNVVLHADNKKLDKYEIDAKVTGNGNDYTLKGSYSNSSALDFYVSMVSLNLESIKDFTGAEISRLRGTAKGDIHVIGTADKPQVIGNLNLKSVFFNYNYLNIPINIYDEKVKFTNEGIVFDFFTVFDTTGNEAIIDGTIFTKDYTAFRFDLEMKTEKFLILNTPPTDQDIYYGKIIVGSSIRVRGDLNRPVVEVNAKLREGTELTLVIPQYLPNLVERQGVVEFVDTKGRLNPILFSAVMRDTAFSGLTGIELVANVEVDKTSLLKLLIDPAAGDYIVARGATTMSVVLDPSGKLSLSGRYEIVEGHYQLTFYNFVRKKFDILPGSNITWAGELLEAEANITARYIVRTSPLELVQAEISDMSEPNKRRYRQRLPFEVLLMMKGELMKPEISFQITMPPEQRDALEGAVYTKLQILNQQDNDLNKQVFSLLVLNRFTTETPFQNAAASSANTLVRASASKVLSQQLNNLTDNYISFVELNLNVQSYEDITTGVPQGRTELQIDLRKQFLNNKIVIEYGGNLDLEGSSDNPNTINNKFAGKRENLSSIPGDIALEYRITYDGTYRIRVYRRNSYDGLIDAQIIRSGIAFLYSKDYDQLRELFHTTSSKDDSGNYIRKPVDQTPVQTP